MIPKERACPARNVKGAFYSTGQRCTALTKGSPSELRSALPRRALKEKSSGTQCSAGFTTTTAGSRDDPRMDQVASTRGRDPRGDAHVLSSAPGMRATPDYTPLKEAGRLPIVVRCEGGGPERAELVCGFLGSDSRPFNPVLSTLPRLLHVRRGTSDGSLEQLVRLALSESAAPSAGSECSSRASASCFRRGRAPVLARAAGGGLGREQACDR
jgi:Cupin